jgi:hydrogenase nickel incorporation protein HypA/HybF
VHELGIAREIVAVAGSAGGPARVRRIVLEVGRLSTVLPDALRFCFDLAAAGTTAEGAALDIVEVPGRARCRECARELALEQPFGRCACGGTDLEWLAGAELRITEMEVA